MGWCEELQGPLLPGKPSIESKPRAARASDQNTICSVIFEIYSPATSAISKHNKEYEAICQMLD